MVLTGVMVMKLTPISEHDLRPVPRYISFTEGKAFCHSAIGELLGGIFVYNFQWTSLALAISLHSLRKSL